MLRSCKSWLIDFQGHPQLPGRLGCCLFSSRLQTPDASHAFPDLQLPEWWYNWANHSVLSGISCIYRGEGHAKNGWYRLGVARMAFVSCDMDTPSCSSMGNSQDGPRKQVGFLLSETEDGVPNFCTYPLILLQLLTAVLSQRL